MTAEAGLERFIQHWDLEQKLNFLPKKQDVRELVSVGGFVEEVVSGRIFKSKAI